MPTDRRGLAGKWSFCDISAMDTCGSSDGFRELAVFEPRSDFISHPPTASTTPPLPVSGDATCGAVERDLIADALALTSAAERLRQPGRPGAAPTTECREPN
jgi:hypothetical protein